MFIFDYLFYRQICCKKIVNHIIYVRVRTITWKPIGQSAWLEHDKLFILIWWRLSQNKHLNVRQMTQPARHSIVRFGVHPSPNQTDSCLGWIVIYDWNTILSCSNPADIQACIQVCYATMLHTVAVSTCVVLTQWIFSRLDLFPTFFQPQLPTSHVSATSACMVYNVEMEMENETQIVFVCPVSCRSTIAIRHMCLWPVRRCDVQQLG